MDIFFIIKIKNLVLIKWSYESPPAFQKVKKEKIMLNSEFKMVVRL